MKLVTTICLCIVLCGCATQQFNFKSNQGMLSEDKMQLFFVSGLGQNNKSYDCLLFVAACLE